LLSRIIIDGVDWECLIDCDEMKTLRRLFLYSSSDFENQTNYCAILYFPDEKTHQSRHHNAHRKRYIFPLQHGKMEGCVYTTSAAAEMTRR